MIKLTQQLIKQSIQKQNPRPPNSLKNKTQI